MNSFTRVLITLTLTVMLVGLLISASGDSPSVEAKGATLASGSVAAVYWREREQEYTGFALKSPSRKPPGAGYVQYVERGEVKGEVYDSWVKIVYQKEKREIWIPSRSVIRIEFTSK